MVSNGASLVSPKRLVEMYPDLLSVATLQRWRTEGIGPPYAVLGPRRIAYSLSVIETWMTDRTVLSTAAARERRRQEAA